MNAVRFDHVSVTYPGAPVLALRDVNLEVAAGEVLLLAGSSGSGKSTLLRCVNGLVPHSTGGRMTGEVVAFGHSTRTARPRDLAAVVGFVAQDPEAQFVIDRVEADIAFVLENLGTEPVAMRRRVEEVLDALGIAHLRGRSPATLSGGEQQRCVIAGALASGPACLVLDEPTSQLDPQGADDVLAAVGRLNDDLGTTVVLAEHRLERAGPMADRVAVLERGRVAACGPVATVLAGYRGAPPVAQLGRLVGWDPPPLTVRDARAHVRAAGGVRQVVGDASPRLRPPPVGEMLLAACDVAVDLGGARVLGETGLVARQGEVVALMGRNGSGKTTLLRALAGLQGLSGGVVERRGRIAYVPQNPNALLFAATVRDELAATLRLVGGPDDGAIAATLEQFGLAAAADRHPRSLSGGERQRVAIAAVAVGGPDVLLLDEPTRGIDAESGARLERALAVHTAAGGAAVVATHDVELAARIADRVVVLAGGEVVASGPAREVLAGSLFAPQVLRVLPPFLTVDEVAEARAR